MLRRVVPLILAMILIFTPLMESFNKVEAAVGDVIHYDFKKSIHAGLEENGWEIADYDLPSGSSVIRNQVYGIQVQSNTAGQYVLFDLDVPEAGTYTVHFNGAGAWAGSIATLYINDMLAGEYNFHSAEYVPEKGEQVLRTFQLNEGIHTFRIEAKERVGGFNMYPGQLELVQVDSMPAVESALLEADRHDLFSGQAAQLTLIATLEDQFDYNLSELPHVEVTFTSSNASIASVNDEGYVQALQPGEVTIEASFPWNGSTERAELDLTVLDLDFSTVLVHPSESQLYPGETTELEVSGLQEDGTDIDLHGADIAYRSLNPDIATVSEGGTVTAVTYGTAVIESDVTLWDTTVTGSTEINVVNPILESITASLIIPKIFVGEQTRIQLEGVMSDGSLAELDTADINYTSSDEAVASVVDGLVTVHQAGEAIIGVTVTWDGVTKASEVLLMAEELTNSKTRQTYYTPEKMEAARENVELYRWAQSQRDAAIAEADQYLELGHDFLWEMVPGQTIPRGYGVNQQLGSPVSGKAIDQYGNYPYHADPVNMPWKLIDPSATDDNGDSYMYPTNDFESYYNSGLDERGIFQPELADPAYLVNELYPEKGPDWGVDDGYGWVDEDGNRYTFIAYYAHWHLWQDGIISDAIQALENAYVLTGDPKYAHAGIIILDRIADVYPDMDISAYPKSEGFLNSDGGTGLGKMVGSIWETGLVRHFIRAYDAFFPAMDDEVVTDFLSEKADMYELGVLKRSGTGIRRNIEDGIIREIYPAVKNAQIRGNNGMHQNTLALAAVVLDHLPETKEWLDFNFQAGAFLSNPYRITGGNILASLVNDVDRDGSGNEASPSYNHLWMRQFLSVADILNGYDLYPEADLYQNVKFRKMFMAQYPLTMLERYTPTIGDTGAAGNPILSLDKSQIVKAFQVYGDPIFAQLAYALNNNHSAGLYADIFTENPEALADQVQAVIDEHGPLKLEGTNLTGYGFSALRDGVRTGSELGISYLFPALTIEDQSVGSKVFPASSTVQLEAEEPGHDITFAFDVEIPGEYEVHLRPFRSPSYGKYNVYLNDELIKEIDFFGSMKELELLTKMELDFGRHLIKFENTGKSAESSNYKMGVTELLLIEVEENMEIEEPIDTMRGLWMYYGRSSGHGHRDTLNLGLHAFGLDLAPDLGYPRFADSTDMNRYQWVNNTISHNTVVVNEGKQHVQEVGFPKHFEGTGRVQLTDVEAPKAYPDTSQYRRTSAMIQVDEEDSYIVDFFRVNGGQDHHFSFHSMEGEVAVEGMDLVPQADDNGNYVGTYAGRDVAFGQRADDVDGTGYMGSGFHWLKDVDRASDPEEQISIDWNVKDTWNMHGNGAGADTDVHLRLTMLTQLDEAALATGVPPDNKPGNPEEIRYFIGHRTAGEGEDMDSLFTSVIEPYQGSRFVQSIEQVSVKQDDVQVDSNDVQAIKVTLENGRTDYIVYSLDVDAEYIIDDQLRFSGFFGVYAVEDGEEVYRYVQDGTEFAPAEEESEPVLARLEGEVLDFTRELEIENEIKIKLDVDGDVNVQAEDLAGKWVFIEDDGIRNAVYEIKAAEALGEDQFLLDIGDTTLIRSFVNVNDFDQGYIYDVAPGASFSIPLSYEQEYEAVPSVESLQQLVEQFTEDGAFANDAAIRALSMHVIAVGVFEQQENAGKVVQHMEGFKVLLNQQKENALMSEEAYEALLKVTHALIEYWEEA